MGIDPTAYAIGLADIERRQIVIGLSISDQDVNASPLKLGTITHRLPITAPKDDTKASPVHPINQPHAFRVAIGNEDMGKAKRQ